MSDLDPFKQFQLFCFQYDLAVDEERYNEKYKINIKFANTDPAAAERVQASLVGSSDDEAYERVTERDLDLAPSAVILSASAPTFAESTGTKNAYVFDATESRLDSQARLLFAKRLRAAWQERGSTRSLDALDKLAQYLLKQLPSLDESALPSSLKHRAMQEKLALRIMSLNEVSACYKGFLQIGYADQCLNLIKKGLKPSKSGPDSAGEGKQIHELVALYNKAQGYLHAQNYDRALAGFRDVSDALKNSNQYFFDARWYGFRRSEERLFNDYLADQSILMAAETLIKMQRSGQADSCLYQPNWELSPYKEKRREVLRVRTENDMKTFLPSESSNMRTSTEASVLCLQKNVNGATKLLDHIGPWGADGLRQANLQSQHQAAKIERLLIIDEWFIKQAIDLLAQIEKNSEPITSDLTKQVKKVLDKVFTKIAGDVQEVAEILESRLISSKENRAETCQTLLDWTKGLALAENIDRLDRQIKREGLLSVCPDIVRPAFKTLINRFINKYFFIEAEAYVSEREPPKKAKVLKHVSDMVCALDFREFSDETRRKLIGGLRKIWHSDVFHETLKTRGLLPEFNKYAQELIKALIPPKEVVPSKLKEFEKADLQAWRERLEAAQEGDHGGTAGGAPGTPGVGAGEGDDNDSRDLRLREFMARRFTNPAMSQDSCCINKYTCHSCVQLESCVDENPALWLDPKCRHIYDELLRKNLAKIRARLWDRRDIEKTPSDWGFMVLQRWNSYTPALTASDGGGYYLYHTGKEGRIDLGIVIDPGYGFVKNFLKSGFAIPDIHAILVSHDHPDHIEDFGRIVNLLVEAKEEIENVQLKPITLCLSKGATQRLQPIIDSDTERELFRDTRTLEPGDAYTLKSMWQDGVEVTLEATKALHLDSGKHDSIGFIMKLGTDIKVGLTCDTRWASDLQKKYEDCDIQCLHLGSIAPERFPIISYTDDEETRDKVLHKKQHLNLPGTLWFADAGLDSQKKQLFIISEFGEEMTAGLRVDFTKKLSEFIRHGERHKSFCAGDVGLLIDPVKKMIKCSCCAEFYNWDVSFKHEVFGDDEQIFYVCPNCQEIMSNDEKISKFKAHTQVRH